MSCKFYDVWCPHFWIYYLLQCKYLVAILTAIEDVSNPTSYGDSKDCIRLPHSDYVIINRVNPASQISSNFVREKKNDPIVNFRNHSSELKYRLQVACSYTRNKLTLSKTCRKINSCVNEMMGKPKSNQII